MNLEITRLAIIECAAAVVLYVGIGAYVGTFRHLALAVVVAPLMLFRTEVSADWGMGIYKRYFDFVERLTESIYFPIFLGFFIAIPIIGMAIRVVATLFWAVRRPIKTLTEMPQNWLRQCFCTDFFHPPEILPLEALKGDPTKIATFLDIPKVVRNEKKWGWKFFSVLVFLPITILGYLPSMVYRVSFKATAVAYAPLIWVAHLTLGNPLSVKIRLERITKGELEKVRRALSWFIVATLTAKLAIVLGWVNRSYIEVKFPSQKLVESLVVPDGWPWWQITLGADALLTFFLLYFADAALARLDSQQAWRGDFVLKAVSMVSFIRAVLSIAAISYFFYIALIGAGFGPILRRLAA